MKEYVFGVDIGGTTVKIGLFLNTGDLIDTWEIPTRTENSGGKILSDIAAAVKEKMEEQRITPDQIEGIGVGVPGPVAPDGTVLKCVNLGWDVFNIESELKQLTGMKAKAGNDANVAALGEMWQGGGKGYQNLVMVTLGTGVGGGVIIGGQILPGIDGAAGEIGHLPIADEETECCGCGKKGCLEQYASANGLVRLAKQYLDSHLEAETIVKTGPSLTAKEVCNAVKKGDKTALLILDMWGQKLGKGLAQIACVVNPEVFVIGGGLSKAGDILMEAVRKHYARYAFHAAVKTDFKFAVLSNEAGIYGAAKMLIE